MVSIVQSVIRSSVRKDGEPLNILSFPTHERYQTNLAETGHNFYLWQSEGIKPWVDGYAPVPKNTVLLNPEKASSQIPEHIDIDLVLSQNKFGQFSIAEQICQQLNVPMISIEHTLPMESWPLQQLESLYRMRGNRNIFISEYSRGRWGWSEKEADIIHHGVNTELFCPEGEKQPVVLSVVNDWVNRDWCCGYNLWEHITGYPNSQLPLRVIGDTPGLSEAAKSTEELVGEYQKSRVFLNTSLISPVPTSLLEAMSCGCAVVTTGTCMIPEIIENGENGFMSNNPEELRGYVDKLLADEKMAAEMGEKARKTILENFGMQKFLNKWNELFLSCVE